MYFSLTGKGQQKAMFVRMSFLSPDGTSHRPIVFSRACGSALAFPKGKSFLKGWRVGLDIFPFA